MQKQHLPPTGLSALIFVLVLLTSPPLCRADTFEYLGCIGGRLSNLQVRGVRGYALEGNAIAVFDLSNPKQIRCIRRMYAAPEPQDFVIRDHYAFVVPFAGQVRIVDLAEVAPQEKENAPRELTDSGIGGNDTSLKLSGEYLIRRTSDDLWAEIFDVSRPSEALRVAHGSGSDWVYHAGKCYWLEAENRDAPESPRQLVEYSEKDRNRSIIDLVKSASMVDASGVYLLKTNGERIALLDENSMTLENDTWFISQSLPLKSPDDYPPERQFMRARVRGGKLEVKRLDPEEEKIDYEANSIRDQYPEIREVRAVVVKSGKVIINDGQAEIDITNPRLPRLVNLTDKKLPDYKKPVPGTLSSRYKGYAYVFNFPNGLSAYKAGHLKEEPVKRFEDIGMEKNDEVIGADSGYLYLRMGSSRRPAVTGITDYLAVYSIKSPLNPVFVGKICEAESPADVARIGDMFLIANNDGGLIIVRKNVGEEVTNDTKQSTSPPVEKE